LEIQRGQTVIPRESFNLSHESRSDALTGGFRHDVAGAKLRLGDHQRPETDRHAVQFTATQAAYENTEIHYAFELLEILAGIRRNTFVFTTLPITGVAPPAVVATLRGATRAYLFNQPRSCISLCRALVEAALGSRIGRKEIADERRRTRRPDKGTLECLIDIAAAGSRPLLSAESASRAHDIRKLGNDVLHKRATPAAERVWGALLDTRAIVEAVYTRPT
jgi:hypothetical protein